MILYPLLLLLLGFILLIGGSNYLIKGASVLGKKYNVSPIVIGMVVVGFGTSLPELIISVVAVLKNSPEISISNVVGSNIANIMIVLGILSLISTIKSISRHTIYFKIPFLIFSSIALFFVANDKMFLFESSNMISRANGIIFLLLFALFLFYTLYIYKEDTQTTEEKTMSGNLLIALMITGGIAGVTFGGNWVVENAIIIAKHMGMSEAFIGLTILAVGSSLPEIFSSVTAALKKEDGIALGNIIGSNIFNTFMILGVASVIRPLPVSGTQQFNITVNIFASLLFFVFVFSGQKGKISKIQGILLLILYTAFIILSEGTDTSKVLDFIPF